MTVGPDYVFIAVPRTASVSIGRYWLLEHYSGIELEGGHHCREVPEEHCDKMIFAVIRNPYARLASFWGLYWRDKPYRVFDDWLRYALEQYREQPQLHCQYDFLSAVRPRVDCVLRYENLEQELVALPFVQTVGFQPLPEENTRIQLAARKIPMKHMAAAGSQGGWDIAETLVPEDELHPERHLTSAQIALINEHSRLDFAYYGYEMLS